MSPARDDRPPSALLDALVRSDELAMLIGSAWESSPLFADARPRAAQGLCAVSLHHGAGVRSLLATLPASATALMRPQFESLVRVLVSRWERCFVPTPMDPHS